MINFFISFKQTPNIITYSNTKKTFICIFGSLNMKTSKVEMALWNLKYQNICIIQSFVACWHETHNTQRWKKRLGYRLSHYAIRAVYGE